MGLIILSWSGNFIIIGNPVVIQIPTFAITDTKRYVPFATL